MTRPSFLLALPLMPLALNACIPNEVAPPAAAPTPSLRLDTDASGASGVSLAEAEPVWTAQQVVPNARTVAAARYIVQPGDTLTGIGNRTGAGLDAIARANALTPPYTLRTGQSLAIPGGRYHSISTGETGIAIATAYDIPWSRIVAANGMTPPFALRLGQRLLLPDSTPTPTPDNLEHRASAFRLDIDDVLTGGQPAAADDAPVATASARPRPLPSNVPIAQPKLFAGHFLWPVRGPILSRFGPGESGARNNGIDIAATTGTPIRAASDGIVAYAGDKVAVFGGLIILTHGSGWVSAYGHASRLTVVRGQKVTKGQVIGQTGDTGYASQPKLHFELRKDRVPVNPLTQLPPA